MSKTVQIAVTHANGSPCLFALQDDGTIWEMHHSKGFHEKKWERVLKIPQTAKEQAVATAKL